jgi:uncharacterized membrane protein (UPF0127 family)
MSPGPGLIVDLTTATVICHRAVVADRPLHRMRGLLGRKSLPAGEGILLRPAPSIHTAFMRFPIDAVFLDRDMNVVKIVERLRPWRVASAQRARAVLELSAGEAQRHRIDVGHRIGIGDPSELTAAPGVAKGFLKNSVAHEDRASAEPARILLVGSDRRFRALASALLTRRGCSVVVGDLIKGTAQLAERERAEVVVIDADLSLTAAAREAAHIGLLSPRVGVVVVGDSAEGLATLPVIAKWDSFDALYSAIERARPQRAI